ncbi:hypothetical protein XELAEV_18034056mg [Xenopus laevis]|uniref:Uncharacterized protein n=1 Tax=Xenopus laevis TaxID=8355 RepID=A0A974CLZ6_XENLA|nr:hypothetical protein XELAEV_18034056mg [Xenopus laevis]
MGLELRNSNTSSVAETSIFDAFITRSRYFVLRLIRDKRKYCRTVKEVATPPMTKGRGQTSSKNETYILLFKRIYIIVPL